MQKTMKIGIVAALLIAVGVVVAMKNRSPRSDAGRSVEPSASESAPEATADETQIELPRLVDLGRGKCIPCKMMAPILDELKEEYAGRLRVDVYNLDDDPGAKDRFNVLLIPTQVFFDPMGNELWRHEGFMSREDILAKWMELGFDLSTDTSIQPEDEGNNDEAE